MNPDEQGTAEPRPEGELAAAYYERNPVRSKCVHCDYNVSGFEIGDLCPECGEIIRTLRIPTMVPDSATAGVVLGSISILGFVISCCGAWPLLFVAPPLSWIGLICSIHARRACIQKRHVYGRSARIRTRLGFWLCVPGVALSVLVCAGFLYAGYGPGP